MDPRNKQIMISRAKLKADRGWTDGLIKRYLGNADKLVPNPNYRSGPPMQLFAVERVELVEAEPDASAALAKAIAKRPKASEVVKRASAKRRDDLLAAVAAVPITILQIPFDQLINEAIAHYNARARAYADLANRGSDGAFLARIAGNYARHCLTDYDAILAMFKGQVGKEDAYWLLRPRIMQAIYDAYPELATLEMRVSA